MRTEQRTVYITNDGSEFTDQALAIRHENVKSIAEYLHRPEGPACWSVRSADEVAEDLINGYVLIPRHVAFDIESKLGVVRKFLDDTLDVEDLVERVDFSLKYLTP
jgi:hypothetical protein